MDEDRIVILEYSQKYLQFQSIWPKNAERPNSGNLLYTKFVFVTLSTFILLYGSLAHMIVAIYERSEVEIDWDISIIVSLIGTYYFNFSYLVNVKKIIRALKNLSNFELFGKPPGYVDFNAKLNNRAKWHQIYIIGAIISLCSSQLLEINKCVANNIEKGLNDVCGLVTNVWFPFDVDYFPVKQIIFLIQIYAAYFSYATSSTISFSIMESMGHVIFRLTHVKDLFVAALNEESHIKRKALLRNCVEYHNFVIRTAETLSESYSSCVFVHVLLTGAILGCNGYQLLKGIYLNTIALFIGWFFSLLMVAFIGQRLTDECILLSKAIYDTKWYELDLATQKDLLLVLLRGRKLLYMRAGAFGVLSYQIVLSILKTSYSIVSVMKGTS